MRHAEPRIAPVTHDDADEAQRERLDALVDASGRALNVFRTLLRSPKAYDGFMAWGSVILSRSNPLPRREAELVILRVGWLCRAGYEWTQHVRIGLRAGLTEEEVGRIKVGPADPAWSDSDRALLEATDQLVGDHDIGDDVWARLGEHFDDDQRMALVMTVGQYTQVSMMLNAFGVQLDEGQTLDPDFPSTPV